MNEMYKYLKEHSYISQNKKSNYQFELSSERAECIANKYDSLTDELQQENKQLKEIINKVIDKLGKYAIVIRSNGEAYTICVDLLDILKEVSE